jgi:hypothetical protein
MFKNQPQIYRDKLIYPNKTHNYFTLSQRIHHHAVEVFREFDANESRFLEFEEFCALLECYWLKHKWGDAFEDNVRPMFNEASSCEKGVSLDDFLEYYNNLADL